MTKKINTKEKVISKNENNNKSVDLKSLDKCAEAAIYYGFTQIEKPSIQKEDRDNVKNLKDGYPINTIGNNKKIEVTAEERSAILRTYFEKNMLILPQPVMLAYEGFIEKEGAPSDKNNKYKKISLDILGSDKSIAEAIIIKTALSILEDNGFKNLYVEINTLGDKESINKFTKELTAYFRKNINDMESHCRQAFKKDPFLVLNCLDYKCVNLKDNAPKSIGCLSDESREQFKEVLEYLESLNINYKINDCLISDRRFTSGTIFEIKQKNDSSKGADESLAIGFRSDSLCKKIGLKKEIPMIGVKIYFKHDTDKNKKSKIKKTSVFFIQLGDEAKHKSLKVIDLLRKENIYINHSLGRDKLTGQLAMAEKMKVPYVLIMGKKEAIDGTIMIRDTATRSQETIKLDQLVSYIKSLIK
jgi:histidyl-tRNA synthetase